MSNLCITLRAFHCLQLNTFVFILQRDFGDLLKFSSDRYAVYVGAERFTGKNNDQDIFEMTSKFPFKPLFTDTNHFHT